MKRSASSFWTMAADLLLARPSRGVGLRLDVIKISAKPIRRAQNLFGMKTICKGDEIVQIGIHAF